VLVIAIVLVVIGLVGVVVPAVPGTILIFSGLLLAAWSDGFVRVGVPTMVLLGVLTIVIYFVDIAMMTMGMKRFGTTKRATAGAALGALAGLFFGLPGMIIGPFAGATLGELTANANWRVAGRAGVAAWIGFLLGTLAKAGLAFAMVGIFLAAWLVW
jgi:uncharacterized protein YqgC (DUF456 family)